jgi:hypothetical protein
MTSGMYLCCGSPNLFKIMYVISSDNLSRGDTIHVILVRDVPPLPNSSKPVRTLNAPILPTRPYISLRPHIVLSATIFTKQPRYRLGARTAQRLRT